MEGNPPNWTDPSGRAWWWLLIPQDAVTTVRQRLIDTLEGGFRVGADGDIDTIAILHAENRWFLGVNSQLDRAMVGRFASPSDIVANRGAQRLTGFNKHAETSAVGEFWLWRGGQRANGIGASMHVSKPPCKTCIFDEIFDIKMGTLPPFPGNLNQTMFDSGISTLNISTVGDWSRFGANPFEITAVDFRTRRWLNDYGFE